ncbi:T6SS effector amidase Tae4 family protein [Cupriavidus sp. EM10]|uniref:T6SS effector amidase Tae4 family protein n=1 Tax=Cupriavidus sp. EM10 TaxID=2839983 RepID=UPI002103E0A3|nr:T6SS effector amidase Tae4 family protein [Cupriavidus sp. EM10]
MRNTTQRHASPRRRPDEVIFGKYVPKMPGKQRLGRDLLNGKPVALRAYEMATWLKQKRQFCGLPDAPQNITGSEWETKIRGRTGIVYFFGYWQQEGIAPGR